MREDIIKLIEENERKGDFSYARVTDDMIQEAEKILGVKLPDQYVEFLKKYGQGSLSGLRETLGVAADGRMTFVETTLRFRKLENLPDNMIVIEYDDYTDGGDDEYYVNDYLMCMDCDTGKVYTWAFWREPRIVVEAHSYDLFENFENFEDFLIEQLEYNANPSEWGAWGGNYF